MSDLPPPPPGSPTVQWDMPIKGAGESSRLNLQEPGSYRSRPDRRFRYILGLLVTALGVATIGLLFFAILRAGAGMPITMMFGWFAGGGIIIAVGNWLRRGP